MSRGEERPFSDLCDGCGKPGVYYAYRDEHLCERCSDMYERRGMSERHLRELLGQVVELWREHWRKRGLSAVEVREVLEKHAVDAAKLQPGLWWQNRRETKDTKSLE